MMSLHRRAIVLAGLLVMCAAGCGKKDDARLVTPKGAARTLFQAMFDNDITTARFCIAQGTGQEELLKGTTKMFVAMRGATDAAHKRFGQEFQDLIGPGLDATRIDPEQIDGGTETITGNSATIKMKDSPTVLRLVKTSQSWRVDLAATFAPKVDLSDKKLRAVFTSMFDGLAKAGDKTKAEIDAGKYPTAQAAVEALVTNMRQSIEDEKANVMKLPN